MFDGKRAEEILRLLRGKGARRVLIQVPEGLKTGVQGLADHLGRNGIEPFISIEPCFGACDLRDSEARRLGCDTLLHVGHADFGVKPDIPVVYYEHPFDFDVLPALRKTAGRIKFRKLCLVTTVQFRESMKDAKKFLEARGFKARDGGTILGCDDRTAEKRGNESECFLFIGSGRFHPLGLQERTEKHVLFLDVEKETLEDLFPEKSRMEIRRRLRIEKARGFANFGIMVSSKPGQARASQAEKIRERLEKAGKKAYLLAADCFSPEKLLGLKIDALVNTACPRMREDVERFGKVMLNPEDIDELVKN